MKTSTKLALAATIVASINVVGVTLIAATLIIPATTARLLTESFSRMIVLSAGASFTTLSASCSAAASSDETVSRAESFMSSFSIIRRSARAGQRRPSIPAIPVA